MAALLSKELVPDTLFDDVKAPEKSGVPDDLFADIKPAESKSQVPDNLFDDISGDVTKDIEKSTIPVTPKSVAKTFSVPRDLSIKDNELQKSDVPKFKPDESKIPEDAKQPGYKSFEEEATNIDTPILPLGDSLFPKRALNPRLGRVAPRGPVSGTVERSSIDQGVEDAVRETVNGLMTERNLAYMMGSAGLGATGAVGKAAVSAFWTAFMGKNAVQEAPEIAKQLGDEMGKPEEDRDKGKIANLLAKAGITTLFTALPAMHLGSEVATGVKGFAETALEGPIVKPIPVDPVLAETAPKTAVSLAQTQNALREVTGKVQEAPETVLEVPKTDLAPNTPSTVEKPVSEPAKGVETVSETGPTPWDYVSQANSRDEYNSGVIVAAQDLEHGTKITDPETGENWEVRKRTSENGSEIVEFFADSPGNSFEVSKRKGGDWKIFGSPENGAFSKSATLTKPKSEPPAKRVETPVEPVVEPKEPSASPISTSMEVVSDESPGSAPQVAEGGSSEVQKPPQPRTEAPAPETSTEQGNEVKPPQERMGLIQMRSKLFGDIGDSLNDWVKSATREQILEKYKLASDMLSEVEAEIKDRKRLGEDEKALFPLRYDTDGIRAVLEHKLMERAEPPVEQNAPEVKPDETTPETLRSGGPVTEGKTAEAEKVQSAASRFRPREQINFDKPLVGPSNAKLVAYEWKWQPEEYVDSRGEERVRRVSNWEEAQSSAETGRDLVHQFLVEMPDGERRLVSAESVPQVLGYSDKVASGKLPSLISAAKTLAKLKMKLATVEARLAENERISGEVAKQKPPIDQISSSKAWKDSQSKAQRFTMPSPEGVSESVHQVQSEAGPATQYTINSLASQWKSLAEKQLGSVHVPESVRDLKNRIARQEKKIGAATEAKPESPVTQAVAKPESKVEQVKDVPQVSDDVSWATGAGDKARSTVSRIDKLPNDPEPMATVDWFGSKRVPVSKLELVKKSSRRIAEEERAAKSAQPEVAIKKIEQQVERTAVESGQRPAKEVKAELVQRLEDAVEEAPGKSQKVLDYEADIDRINELKDRYYQIDQFGKSKQGRALRPEAEAIFAKYGVDPVKQPRLSVLADKIQELRDTEVAKSGKVTIDIPGDGSFTIANTKQNLTEVLNRAEKIKTGTGGDKGFTESKPTKEQGKQWMGEAEASASEPSKPVSKPTKAEHSIDFESASGDRIKVVVSAEKYSDLSAYAKSQVDLAYRRTLELNDKDFQKWEKIKEGKSKVTVEERIEGSGDSRQGVTLDTPDEAFSRWASRSDLHDAKLNESGQALRDKILSEREAAAKTKADKETADRAESDRKRKEFNDYSEAISNVDLPTGKKTTLTVESKSGEKSTLTGTQYGDWFIHKVEGGTSKYSKPTVYKVTHVKSGLGVSSEGFTSLEQAKTYVRALIDAKVKTDFKSAADLKPEEIAHIAEVHNAWVEAGDVPKYFKAKPEPPEPKIQGEEPLEQRIKGKSKKSNPLEMEEGDLADYFEERFGESTSTGKPGEARRTGTYTFPTYEAFKKFMQERYAERDLDGMKLAFAEAPTENKVKYAKEFGIGNVDPHLKGWVTHIATGAELPPGAAPIPRTSPRPTPTGSGPVPPATPAEPPPPPRTPTPYRKFDLTALTQVFRQFGKSPVVNERLSRAYGRFIPATEAVELKSRLLWDTKLAERVLGHEIGHFIDLVVPMIGKGKGFADRLAPLLDFKRALFSKADLRQDARNLSREWRGDFRNGDSYRDTAKELMADFMSAMFNNPEWVNEKYPRLHDAFQDLRDSKPGFKSAYREIETWLQGDTMAKELQVQDRAAINRTFDTIMDEKKKSRASFMDRLTFDMLSLWERAFKQEGKPRQIGSSISEKLATSYMWSAKKLALWHDDFVSKVQPELDKVSDDPIEARAHLLSYTKAVRTIGEVRAAGQWIKDNPTESRTMLEHVLGLDAGLREKFGGALSSVPDSGLYDLSAAIFREVHDRGDKFVTRISREINDLNLGVKGEAALMAFNVRGKLLNPGGLTPDSAQKMIDQLKTDLNPDQFKALENGAQNLRDLIYDVQKEMHDSGLISDKIWKELIEPNRDNYVPYAVLDYFDGRVRAGVMPQKGTALDVADVAVASELKAVSSYQWLQKQRQVQLLQQIYGTEPGEALRRASDIEGIRARHTSDDVSRAVIWKDGAPHVIEFPGDPGKLLQDALAQPEFYNHVEWLADAAKITHGIQQIYTQLSPRFLFYRNLIRGFRTAGLKVGFGSALKQVTGSRFSENLKLARNYADAAFGAEMLPEVREMVDSEALPPPRVAMGAVRDLPHMREQLTRGALPIFSAERLRPDTKKTSGPVWNALREGKNMTDRMFTGYEAFEKIYNYKAAIDKGLDPETATAIAQRGGIPRPGVAGKWSIAAEILFPWTRVKMQGTRASYEMMRDPRFRNGFAARFAVTEALPRMAKIAIGVGLASKAINWIMRKDEDKDDSVMAEVMKRVSPYKMALDDVVPMMFFDPRSGEYHPFWKYKSGGEVPKHFEVVSLRLPSSEEGNMWGTMLYNAMLSAPGAKEKMGTPGQGIVENMGRWAGNMLGPTLSPMIETSSQLETMVLEGRNPPDSFRGAPAANPQLFEAGGMEKAQAIAGYVLNKMGGPGELAGIMAGNLGLLDERAMNALSQRLNKDHQAVYERLPFTGAVVSHDNYAQYRTEKIDALEEARLRTRARLIMSPDVKQLYDFYYRNLKRQDKLDSVDQVRFELSKDFMKDVWGTLTVKGQPNSDSFYSKAAHAIGKDGSSQAKTTVKRDLDTASQVYVEMFKQAAKTDTDQKPADLRYGK